MIASVAVIGGGLFGFDISVRIPNGEASTVYLKSDKRYL